MSILKIPAEEVGTFNGDYEPAEFTRAGSTKSGYPNGGASYSRHSDEFDQSDDEAQGGGVSGFEDGHYDCKFGLLHPQIHLSRGQRSEYNLCYWHVFLLVHTIVFLYSFRAAFVQHPTPWRLCDCIYHNHLQVHSSLQPHTTVLMFR